MRVIKINQVNKNILGNRKKVNEELFSDRVYAPRVRRERSRSRDERIALTEVAKASVERAKREGKMKMVGKRKMYYDASE